MAVILAKPSSSLLCLLALLLLHLLPPLSFSFLLSLLPFLLLPSSFLFLPASFHQELESVRSSLSAREEELKAVKKENRKRRKVIEAYQEMMSAGATGLHTVSRSVTVYKTLVIAGRPFLQSEPCHSGFSPGLLTTLLFLVSR